MYKKGIIQIGQLYHLSILAYGGWGEVSKEMQTNIITIIIHLQIFKRVKVNMLGCDFVETKPEIILFIKTKGRKL